MSASLQAIQDQLDELHRKHPTSEMAEAAQLMIAMLDLALHGYTTARPDTPRAYWHKLLTEVEQNRAALGQVERAKDHP